MDAAPAVDAIIRRGADRMLADPSKLGLLLYPADPYSIFDRTPETLSMLVGDLHLKMQRLGEAGHWAYDGNAMLALRQAKLAVEEARNFGGWAEARRARLTHATPALVAAE